MNRKIWILGLVAMLAFAWGASMQAHASGSYVASPFAKKKKAGEPAAEASPTPSPTPTETPKAGKPAKK